MTDGYGREIDYLRVSLTDKCNLRCGYCMPEEGIKHLAHSDILTLEEIARVVSVMRDLGIKKVRLTGGEPLVRKGVIGLIKMLSDKIDIVPSTDMGSDDNAAYCTGTERSTAIVMTTNGIRLPEMASGLKEAGLSEVNISLDTLKRDTFIRLTGSDELDSVLSGIGTACDAGLKVKLNCVPIRDVNDDEIEPLISFAQKTGADIRFIELMPIGCGAIYEGIPSDELIKKLEKTFGKAHKDVCKGNDTDGEDGAGSKEYSSVKGPAEYYRFDGPDIRIGFISPMSHRFCEHCNRVRLTAEGFLKLCLQYPCGIDLRSLLRGGASDDEIKDEICRAVKDKPSSHCFGQASEDDARKMIQIGG